MADVAGAVVGGTIGFFVGGPMGALYGAQIGMSAGSMLMGGQDQVVQGPKIGELATQNSKEGVPRPIVFGVGRPIGGNIMASGKPIIKVVREKVSSGGKGGGGGGDTYTEREEVYRTYAIRICEGPVTGIRRVWRDNKLVYDALAGDAARMDRIKEKDARAREKGGKWESDQQDNNLEFLKSARFYLGGYDQMPDPALQSEFGVANVTAYRGTCYMVMDNEDLTPRRGSIPQYVFEVVRGEGFALTSKPYPVEVVESSRLDNNGVSGVAVRTIYQYKTLKEQATWTSADITKVNLRVSVKKYTPQEMSSLMGDITKINLRSLVVEEGSREDAKVTPDIVAAKLYNNAINYSAKPENAWLTQSITSIKLVTS